MSSILDPLKDTGDQDSIETPSPDELEAMSKHPATRLDVWAAGRKHAGTCTARKFTRQLRTALYVALGAFLTLQAGALLAGRAMLRDVVREAVRAELGKPNHATAFPDIPSMIRSAEAATLPKELP
jgi:hypothetical protein